MQEEQDCAHLRFLHPKESFRHFPPDFESPVLSCHLQGQATYTLVLKLQERASDMLLYSLKYLRSCRKITSNTHLSIFLQKKKKKRHFGTTRNIKKTAVAGSAAIHSEHTASGAIHPQHLLSSCQIRVWKDIFVYVYYWEQQGDADCVHYFCSALSTTEAQLSHDFWKMSSLAHSSSLTTATTDPLHSRCPFLSLSQANSSPHIEQMAHLCELFFDTEASGLVFS